MAHGMPEILADSRRLGQVLVNLILNASKFGHPNTSIDLTVIVRAGVVRVAVADRGPGVSIEQSERLFEPYYRGPSPPASARTVSASACPSSSPSSRPTVARWASRVAAEVALDSGSPCRR